MTENLLKAGAATFLVVDGALKHKDDDPFVLWLTSEGFSSQSLGYGNTDFLYINIQSKIYNWGMAGIALAPILGGHCIHIDEFKAIYSILTKYKGLPTCFYSQEAFDRMMSRQPKPRPWTEQEEKEFQEFLKTVKIPNFIAVAQDMKNKGESLEHIKEFIEM